MAVIANTAPCDGVKSCVTARSDVCWADKRCVSVCRMLRRLQVCLSSCRKLPSLMTCSTALRSLVVVCDISVQCFVLTLRLCSRDRCGRDWHSTSTLWRSCFTSWCSCVSVLWLLGHCDIWILLKFCFHYLEGIGWATTKGIWPVNYLFLLLQKNFFFFGTRSNWELLQEKRLITQILYVSVSVFVFVFVFVVSFRFSCCMSFVFSFCFVVSSYLCTLDELPFYLVTSAVAVPLTLLHWWQEVLSAVDCAQVIFVEVGLL